MPATFAAFAEAIGGRHSSVGMFLLAEDIARLVADRNYRLAASSLFSQGLPMDFVITLM